MAKTLMEAIGTTEALQLSKSLAREWREIQRPPLDHPDQDLLWQAEHVCRELVELRNNPDVRLPSSAASANTSLESRKGHLILKREHDIAFIGSKGIGKSTAICKIHRTGSARSGRRPCAARP